VTEIGDVPQGTALSPSSGLEDDEQSRVLGTKIRKLALCPQICTHMKEAKAFLRGKERFKKILEQAKREFAWKIHKHEDE